MDGFMLAGRDCDSPKGIKNRETFRFYDYISINIVVSIKKFVTKICNYMWTSDGTEKMRWETGYTATESVILNFMGILWEFYLFYVFMGFFSLLCFKSEHNYYRYQLWFLWLRQFFLLTFFLCFFPLQMILDRRSISGVA